MLQGLRDRKLNVAVAAVDTGDEHGDLSTDLEFHILEISDVAVRDKSIAFSADVDNQAVFTAVDDGPITDLTAFKLARG